MSSMSNVSRSARIAFWVGWGVLLFLLAAYAINHLLGIWFYASSADESHMFEVFSALNLLALVILVIPYRQLQRWAWWALWVGIAPVALTFAFFQSSIGLTYLVTAGAMALAQFATLSVFLDRSAGGRAATASGSPAAFNAQA